MADSDDRRDNLPAASGPNGSLSPEDAGLPPIEPPSARFIVQLFVVPALIVAAVIGVYLLFGKLASRDVDWREHAADLRSANPQVRWRAALGLAQLLEADTLRGTRDKPLAEEADLAAELAETLTQELSRPVEGEDHQRLLDYLVKAVGWMDVPQTVLPPLRSAAQPDRPEPLQQQALNAIAMVTGRAFEKGQPISDAALTKELIAGTNAPTSILRHLSAYNLGLLDSPEATARLQELIDDQDEFLRLQAAIGLARRKSLEGLPVFEDILREAGLRTFDPTTVHTQEEANAYFEAAKPVVQALTAAANLRGEFSPQQTADLIRLVEPLTKVTDAELRHHAIETLSLLKSPAADR